MPITLIDKRFDSEITYESFTFSGGEEHVKARIPVHASVEVVAELWSSKDLVQLLLVCDSLDRQGRAYELKIPYFPYARQDRICDYGEAFSLRVITDIVKRLQYYSLVIEDPHSDVTAALLEDEDTRLTVRPQHNLIPPKLIKGKLLVCPDAGAEKKVLKLAQKHKTDYILATKVRDVTTGEITSTEVYATRNTVEGKDCIIVDDICDGGRTFIELAKVLKAKGAKTVTLYVTHGIFSKGFLALQPHIDQVYWRNNPPLLGEKEQFDTLKITGLKGKKL